MRDRQSSAAEIALRATGKSSRPASVRATLWLVRSNSSVSNSFSSCLICWDSVLCVMQSERAASEKLRHSASLTKYLICRNSIMWQVCVAVGDERLLSVLFKSNKKESILWPETA